MVDVKKELWPGLARVCGWKTATRDMTPNSILDLVWPRAQRLIIDECGLKKIPLKELGADFGGIWIQFGGEKSTRIGKADLDDYFRADDFIGMDRFIRKSVRDGYTYSPIERWLDSWG